MAKQLDTYSRQTTEVSMQEVPRPLIATLEAHAEKRQLKLEDVRCWLTRSDNPPAMGFFGRLFGRRANPVDPNAWSMTLVALHPTHILVSFHDESGTSATLSAPQTQLWLHEGAGGGVTRGVTLTGFPSAFAGGEPSSYYVGLDTGPAGEECAAALEAALVAAKNPG